LNPHGFYKKLGFGDAPFVLDSWRMDGLDLAVRSLRQFEAIYALWPELKVIIFSLLIFNRTKSRKPQRRNPQRREPLRRRARVRVIRRSTSRSSVLLAI
jgi:hypothetical protein